jgi:hypothetical protein
MSHTRRHIIVGFRAPGAETLTAETDPPLGASGSIDYVPPDDATPEQISAHVRKIIKLADKMNEPGTED